MINNILEIKHKNFNKEIFETLLKTPNIKIERIISFGHNSPIDFWYNQSQNEWVMIIDGEAKIEFEDNIIKLKKGDYFLIEKYKKHRVEWTKPNKPTIWLAIFFD